MQVKDLGEFGLIDLLNRMVVKERSPHLLGDQGAPLGFGLMVDTGDDTAAWRTGPATELFTTDTVVEDVHFTRHTTPWRDLGWKCLAANISDIASMGGRPMYALVTLGLPPETLVADIQELYRGLLDIANRHGVIIVGGDMVRSPVVFITVGLTGVRSGMPLLRSSARPGQLVGVTGYVGSSGGGLKLLLEGVSASAQAAEYLFRAHRRPEPAVAAGGILAQAGVNAAMDISDGLADDLSKLCIASKVSARIFARQIPIHPWLKAVFPEECLDLALYGGEDYQLLFTASSQVMEQVLPRLPEGSAIIGEITPGPPGQVTVVDAAGVEVTADRAGWDHFTRHD
jgi:thiamine-monophosphate kinase